MMRFDMPLLVENDEKMIYQVKYYEMFGNAMAYLYLTLVCGYDYIDPDTSDIQGYVPQSRFTEEVQQEIVSCDLFAEGMEKALNDEGYKVLKELPKIYRKELDKWQNRA